MKKFAPLGVKERHQAVEKKRQGKKEDFHNCNILVKIVENIEAATENT